MGDVFGVSVLDCCRGWACNGRLAGDGLRRLLRRLTGWLVGGVHSPLLPCPDLAWVDKN
jgi:hypothetical protein